jgi:hypothetical protein
VTAGGGVGRGGSRDAATAFAAAAAAEVSPSGGGGEGGGGGGGREEEAAAAALEGGEEGEEGGGEEGAASFVAAVVAAAPAVVAEEEEEELSFVEGAREEEREALPGLRTRAAMLAAVEVAVVLSSRVSFFDSTSALRVFAFARARLSKRGLALFLSASFVLVEPRVHYKRRPAG